MHHLPKPKAVLFDWDNTLVDTWPVIHLALTHAFTTMGMDAWTLEQTKARVRKSMRDSFPEVFGENWQEAGRIYQNKYRECHLDQLKAINGAEEMLRILRAKVPYLGIVSNKTGENLRKELAALKWNHYFDCAVGSGDSPRDKPYPDPVHLALQGSNITPGRDVWFIGDSDIDIECANGLNLTAILYGDAVIHNEAKLTVHHKVTRLSSICDF